MARKSEDTIVTNKLLYTKLAPQYIKIINELEEKYPIYEDAFFADLVNFKQNKSTPKHKWFLYKHGYAENLVKQIINKESPSKKHYVLDPFTGVGTTNLVAQELGYKSIGFDINPVAVLAALVKTYHYTEKEIENIKNNINSFKPIRSTQIPESPLLERSFQKYIFTQLMGIKGFYESIKNEKISNFFKLAYLSIIEDCSNRIKDGNGLKISNKKNVIKDANSYFIETATSMLGDLRFSNFNEEVNIYDSSLINDSSSLRNKKVGITIFSPPYANCFDYCEVYKLELWMGGFVLDYDGFKKYRNIAVRSHVNSSFNHSIKNNNDEVELIANLLSAFNLWNKNIPDMIRGYFDDMTVVFQKIQESMVPGGKCYIVVANSGYRGVLVPTDLILADISTRLGFKVNEIIYARKIRASSQQMRVLHDKYNNLMRESIIIIEKIK